MNYIYIVENKMSMFPTTTILKLKSEESEKIKREEDFFIFSTEDEAVKHVLQHNNNLKLEEKKKINQRYKKDIRDIEQMFSEIMIQIKETKINLI